MGDEDLLQTFELEPQAFHIYFGVAAYESIGESLAICGKQSGIGGGHGGLEAALVLAGTA